MKYWSFWYFWSIFILATMCNINTQIPVYQNQRSHAEQDHSLLHGSSSTSSCSPGWARGSAPSLATALGWAAASEHTRQAGEGYDSVPTPSLDHDGFCRACQRQFPLSAEHPALPGILRQPGGKALPCLTAWHCYLDSQRWQKWSLQCLWESLTPTCLQQTLRDHSEELWHLVFLHFVFSGHHHPEVEFPINYLSVFCMPQFYILYLLLNFIWNVCPIWRHTGQQFFLSSFLSIVVYITCVHKQSLVKLSRF